jgi:NitT/TauT family transport system substrate-binding protein
MANKLKFLTIIALLVSACSTPEDEATVTFNMAWLPQGSMSGIIVAIDRGFYSDVGLDVEAVRGFGGIRTVNEIDQGMFEFGYGDALAVILNRSNGGKTKLVGAINQDWPSGLCYVTSRHNIKTPADLKGLTVGGGQASAMQVLVPEWLELNGVPRDAINLMQLDPAIVVNSLVEGQIDAGECWKANSMPIFHKRAAVAGHEIDWIPYADFGLDIYGNGIVTSEKLIEENPELVRQFLAATYRGYQWVHDNPDAATEIVISHYPVLDKEITRQQITELMELMQADGGMGSLEKDKVSRTLDFLAGAYSVEEPITVDDIYTTEFLNSGN